MIKVNKGQRGHSNGGFSTIELLAVTALIGIVCAITVPPMLAYRRLLRTSGIGREIVSQLRYARQLAMSERQSFTFQYDHTNKQILIIDSNANGPGVLTDASYPNNPGSAVVSTVRLATGGLNGSEIAYGIPNGLPTAALGDGVNRTNLSGDKLNITFQPDGSVVDTNGNPLDRALFIYNTRAASETATAISVVGSAGRIKLWRYNSSANYYAE